MIFIGSIIGFILFFAFIFIVFSAVFGDNAIYVCKRCGSAGKSNPAGSFAISLILWICFLVPGMIYSVWRSKTRICRSCDSREIVPENTPIGKQLIEEKKRIDYENKANSAFAKT